VKRALKNISKMIPSNKLKKIIIDEIIKYIGSNEELDDDVFISTSKELTVIKRFLIENEQILNKIIYFLAILSKFCNATAAN
jgi:hypothetical protein